MVEMATMSVAASTFSSDNRAIPRGPIVGCKRSLKRYCANNTTMHDSMCSINTNGPRSGICVIRYCQDDKAPRP